MMSTEEHRPLSITSSEDYSLVFTSGSMFIFQDDDFKENENLEPSDSMGVIDEYLKIPKKHQPTDIDVLSLSGKHNHYQDAHKRHNIRKFLQTP